MKYLERKGEMYKMKVGKERTKERDKEEEKMAKCFK